MCTGNGQAGWEHLTAYACVTINLKASSQMGPQVLDKGEDPSRGPANLNMTCSDLLAGQGGTKAQELLAGC